VHRIDPERQLGSLLAELFSGDMTLVVKGEQLLALIVAASI
jgi:hypothetical protein